MAAFKISQNKGSLHSETQEDFRDIALCAHVHVYSGTDTALTTHMEIHTELVRTRIDTLKLTVMMLKFFCTAVKEYLLIAL